MINVTGKITQNLHLTFKCTYKNTFLLLIIMQRVSTVKLGDRCCQRHKNSADCCHRVVTQRLHSKAF